MKIFFAATALTALAALTSSLAFPAACFAQTEVVCGQTLSAPLRSGAQLAIHSRPAGLEIAGTDRETIQVVCTADDMASAQHIRLRISGTSDHARLTISGGYVKHGNLQIRMEVPQRTGLGVSMSAGEVTVKEVEGDKDFGLYAGQITISSSRPWNYRRVDASVDIGEVNALVYSEDKGGFFRRFTRDTAGGEYRLRAHVMTGEIDLVGAKTNADSSKAD